jgi:hypothetical protein
MESLLVGAAVLACPVGMGVMMWLMARGMKNRPRDEPPAASLEQLRAEHRRLGEQIEHLDRPQRTLSRS